MNLRVVAALVWKDFCLFLRNRFFAAVSALGIVVYLAIYFAMPGSVDETLEVGLYAPVVPPVVEQLQGEGVELKKVASEEALKQAVADGRYVAGVVLPPDIMDKLAAGEQARIELYFAPDAPQEIKGGVEVLVTELAYLQAGEQAAVELSEEIVGMDMAGMQIPPRDRLRPLFAVFLIIFETFALANLISEEAERRTIHALLVTPMRMRELFLAKGITGTSLAFAQAVLFMAIVGGMTREPLVVLVALLLGAVLATGVGFLIASVARDMMSVMAWGVVVFIVLMIPCFSIVLPGTLSHWVEVIPSYYLVDTVHRAAGFGSSWGSLWSNLAILLGYEAVIVCTGILALRRRFR